MTTQRQAGLYYDVPNPEYHAGLRTGPKPLSSTMAKTLVTKSPAEFQYESENRVEKAAYDEGQAIHELVLEGKFKTVDVLDFDSWQTNASKEARADSYLNRRVPMLKKDVEPLEAIADGVRKSPLAASIFTAGKPEVSALAQDPESGIWLQARFDWLRLPEKGRPLIADLKTTAKGANPRAFNREIAERSYHLSAAFYRRVLKLLGYDEPEFIFVPVSKAPPHLPSVIRMSEMDLGVGDLLVDKAIATYAACLETGEWPGYDTEIVTSSMPIWASYEAEDIAGIAPEPVELKGVSA